MFSALSFFGVSVQLKNTEWRSSGQLNLKTYLWAHAFKVQVHFFLKKELINLLHLELYYFVSDSNLLRFLEDCHNLHLFHPKWCILNTCKLTLLGHRKTVTSTKGAISGSYGLCIFNSPQCWKIQPNHSGCRCSLVGVVIITLWSSELWKGKCPLWTISVVSILYPKPFAVHTCGIGTYKNDWYGVTGVVALHLFACSSVVVPHFR